MPAMTRLSVSVLTGIAVAMIAHAARMAYFVLSGYSLTFHAAASEMADGMTLLKLVILGPLIENLIILVMVFLFEKGLRSLSPYAALLVIAPLAYWLHGGTPIDFVHAINFCLYTILFIRMRSDSTRATAYTCSVIAHGMANFIRILVCMLPYDLLITKSGS